MRAKTLGSWAGCSPLLGTLWLQKGKFRSGFGTERWRLKTEEPAQVWDQVQECSRWGCWCPGRARVGRPAQPEPTPGLAPSPAHTLSRGLRSIGSEIPTTGSSLSSTAHLFSERNLQGRTLERNSSQGAHNWCCSALNPLILT